MSAERSALPVRSVAVEGALDVHRAGLDGGQGVGNRATGVVVAVDADIGTGGLSICDDGADPAG